MISYLREKSESYFQWKVWDKQENIFCSPNSFGDSHYNNEIFETPKEAIEVKAELYPDEDYTLCLIEITPLQFHEG